MEGDDRRHDGDALQLIYGLQVVVTTTTMAKKKPSQRDDEEKKILCFLNDDEVELMARGS